MDPTQVTIALAIAPFLVGGSVLYWLGKTHPTREEVARDIGTVVKDMTKDLNAIGKSLNTAREDIKVNRAIADEALHRSEHAKTEVMRQHEHIEKNLVGPIRELASKMSAMEVEVAKQGESARFVERTLTEIKDWLYEDEHTHRRKP